MDGQATQSPVEELLKLVPSVKVFYKISSCSQSDSAGANLCDSYIFYFVGEVIGFSLRFTRLVCASGLAS